MSKAYYCALFCTLLFTALPVAALPQLRLAAVFAKTGEASEYDQISLRLTRDLVAQHNASADRTFNVELIEIDNRSSAAGATRAAWLAIKADVHLVLGANRSSQSLAMAAVLETAGLPMVCPAATQNELTVGRQYVFRLNYSNDMLGSAAAVFARQHLQAATAVVMVNQSQIYSQQISQVFSQQFAALGGKVLASLDYLNDTRDFRPLLQQALPLQPALIFMPGYSADTGALLRQLRAQTMIPLLCADGCLANIQRYAGGNTTAVYGLFNWHPALAGMEAHPFQQWLTQHQLSFVSSAALTYDAIHLILQTAASVPRIDRRSLQQQLAATRRFQGITGLINLQPGVLAIKPAYALDLSVEPARLLGHVQVPAGLLQQTVQQGEQ